MRKLIGIPLLSLSIITLKESTNEQLNLFNF